MAMTLDDGRDRELLDSGDDAADRQLDEATRWTTEDWEDLILSIQVKACTPFLGAGAASPLLPLGGEVSRAFASEFKYPFPDVTNLPRVAQYVSIVRAANTAKYRIKLDFEKRLAAERATNYTTILDECDPHRVVADLELPLYITTNYDDLMFQALIHSTPPTLPSRKPVQMVCPWRPRRRGMDDVPDIPIQQSPSTPVVYHLHGHFGDIDSMVLTEDDYLTFVESLVVDQNKIVTRLNAAFASTTLLFLGYSLEDFNFKLLLRQLGTYLGKAEGARHVAVQLPPAGNGTEEERLRIGQAQRTYLMKQYNLQRVKIYWGTCRDFATELRQRWAKMT